MDIYILHDLGICFASPIPFHCDIQATMYVAANQVFHERTMHLDYD